MIRSLERIWTSFRCVILLTTSGHRFLLNCGHGYLVRLISYPIGWTSQSDYVPADSYEYLCVPKPILHGFDFSYQGLLGIWEGFQPLPVPQGPNILATNNYYDLAEHWETHPSVDELYGNFSAALKALLARRDCSWKPPVATSKSLHRQVALQLIGWSFREDDFTKMLQG